MKNLANLSLLLVLILLDSCVVIERPFSALPPGVWRAELDLSRPGLDAAGEAANQFERDTKLPFLFEVVYDSRDSFYIEIINGQERIKIDDLSFGHNRANGQDSLLINFEEYNTYILAYFEEDVLEGRWYIPGRGDYSIPFLAKHGKDRRFDHVEPYKHLDVSGLWSVTFGIEDSTHSYPAIGEFQQDSIDVTGTFRTETGDYRYLAGQVIGDHLWLSCFDGSHAFLFKSKITSSNEMNGFFKSGNHFETFWSAEKDEEAQLTDPDSLTTNTSSEFIFNFSDAQGQSINLDSASLANRAKIIQVMGTWCPNCKDESTFLNSYLKAYTKEDLAIIGLGFERTDDKMKGQNQIEKYRAKFSLDYPIYYAGKASKSVASEALPSLSGITSFPTLIFLNKQNEVVRIHTGFNGPATSQYEDFKTSFSETVKQITSDE